MLSIGLDYHVRMSAICVLDENGKTNNTQVIHGTMDILLEELKKIKKPFKICFEASTGYGVLYERLLALKPARQVAVVHPGKVRLIFNTKRKTDRIDAKKLATLLFLDQLPQVYVPSVSIDPRAQIDEDVEIGPFCVIVQLRHQKGYGQKSDVSG